MGLSSILGQHKPAPQTKRPRVQLPLCELYETEPISNRPQRNIARKNYSELEMPEDDKFIFCEICNQEYLDGCEEHGKFIIINDSKVPKGKPDRAFETVPDGLMVKKSKIPRAGRGVFTDKLLLTGLRFGPYEGELRSRYDEMEVHKSGYAWLICRDGKPHHFIDASDVSLSNWMRFVNCARNEEEQNLEAFQYNGEIYYRTIKHINPGRELLVWYGEDYAKEIGIDCKSKAWGKSSRDKTVKTTMKIISKNRPKNMEIKPLGEIKSSTLNISPVQADKYRCPFCIWPALSTANTLMEHIRRKHPDADPAEVRKVADQIYIKLQKTDEQQKTCGVCSKTFSRAADLRRHISVHTGIKQFECNVCGKTFTHNGNLQTHISVHTGIKQFECNVCGKTFTHNGNLKRHFRIHSGEKPYRCSICDKSYNDSGNLQTHMRIHTGEKPYVCSICGMRFTRSSNLQTHMKLHSGEKPYHCDLCDQSFTQRAGLYYHKKTKHSV
ncbi:putative histone-lysine N-methyltransferase PRDM6 [Tubulanus polymorphus]|uniref:putative histone-lysine N-methyltransferase PRDM6 n=1 Tax=Tubulanus polymorphus TaxID=672921 RepID=UPI003DA62117